MRRKTVLALALSLLSLLQLPSGAAEMVIPNFWDVKERLPKPELSTLTRLRFLTTVDFPPFNFLDSNGKLSGFHVDLVRAICAELAVVDRCQIQALPWEELEATLTRGDAEAIVAGIAVSADSRRKFAFSRSYLRFPARFIMPRSAILSEPLYAKVGGKRIGVAAGTAHEAMLREYFPDVRVVTYTREKWLFDDLKERKLDGAFGDGMKFSFWLAGTDSSACCQFAGGPYLAPEYLGQGLAIAMKPEDADLVEAIDYALREIHAKGVFEEIYLRYFPVSFF